MTMRERTAALLAGVGVVLVCAGAYGYDGVRFASVVAGGLLLAAGVALGFGDPDPVAPTLDSVDAVNAELDRLEAAAAELMLLREELARHEGEEAA